MTRIIDLSLPHQNFASEPYPPSITHTTHEEGARRLAVLAKIDPTDFENGMALASDQVTASTHSGTHVDAPWHYGPTVDGKPAKTIDQVPLEWCYGNGVVLDFRHLEQGSEINVDDVKAALQKINYSLKEGDIVLIQTGADKFWGTTKYLPAQSGLGMDATEFILNQGIKVIGIDGWGLDRPVAKMVDSFQKSGDKKDLWPSHFYGRRKEYLQIEKMANLDQLPAPTGFKVACFPIKIERGSAGWTRAVAIIED
ncbi:MAG: cyclase [Chloroflexi bacterium 44-23]|nr:MAG: cyclase [Chloroflexi bacterium 44-23]